MVMPVTDPTDRRATWRRGRSVIAVACLAGACGGSQPEPAPRAPAPPPPRTEDLTIDLETVTLTGTVFVPEGLPPPAVPSVRPRRRTTVDKQRAAWKKVAADPRAPLARKATEAQVLATLLLDRVRALPADAPARAPLLDEARAALAAVIDAGREQTDRVTLEMAAALALAAGDPAGATRFLDDLLVRFPDSPAAVTARAQLAFTQLVAGGDATATLSGLFATAEQPGLAYVLAWVRFREGDATAAAAAIAAAAAGWKDAATRPAVLRDYLVMAARGQVAPATAADGLAALVADGAPRAAALRDLALSYELAGRPVEAEATLELLLARHGGLLDAAEQVAIRRTQAELAWRAGRLDTLGDRWSEVARALAACTGCAADLRAAIAAELAQRAYELHTVHVTSGDAAAKTAAAALYRVHASLPDAADAEAVAAHARELAAARIPDDASQYHEAVRVPLRARLQEVLACYELPLQGDPSIGGPLTVRLEVDQAGAVTGVATEPAPGREGMAAAARCVEARAREWTLPTRPRPGVARIGLPFLLGSVLPR